MGVSAKLCSAHLNRVPRLMPSGFMRWVYFVNQRTKQSCSHAVKAWLQPVRCCYLRCAGRTTDPVAAAS
jgi:hypothetical protein